MKDEAGYNPYPKSSVYVHRAEDIPSVEHWAILESSSYATEESGVWAPGHGYPATIENFVTYTAYTVKEDFEAELKYRLTKDNRWSRTFRGIHVLPVNVRTTVTIE